ncbi:MAG: alpha/beta hydrolase [Ilumatobacter sp.]|nr:alpha/beta hydrolase [Ilumatobacter sp.]MDG2232941.1 alpha/beta hydrolase [Ilumatobacter sp.]
MTDDSATRSSDPPAPALVVFVHGAWHGAWCWSALQAELDQRGIASLAVDLPGHGTSAPPIGGLHDDAAAVTSLLDHLAARDAGRVALVGHSYGGAVISQAAAGRDDISHLTYLAAFALDEGESVLSCLGSLERRDVELAAAMVPTTDGLATTLDPTKAAAALYGSCPPSAVRAALRRLGPQSMTSMTETTSGAPRQVIPSTYVVCTQDRAVHPAHQRTLAERCSEQHELDTDHSPFMSAVGPTADIIEQISSAA